MKGQAAIEFVLTYGWAVLVVILMISGLAYLGILNVDNIIPDKCFFSAGIGCQEHIVYKVGSEEKVSVILLNNLGDTIIINSPPEISDVDEVSGCSCGGGNCGIEGVWEPSKTKKLEFTCTNDIEKVNLRIRLTYKYLKGDYDRVIEGKIQSKVIQ